MEQHSSSVDDAATRFLRSLGELQRGLDKIRSPELGIGERKDAQEVTMKNDSIENTSGAHQLRQQQQRSMVSVCLREVNELERVSRELDDSMASSNRILEEVQGYFL